MLHGSYTAYIKPSSDWSGWGFKPQMLHLNIRDFQSTDTYQCGTWDEEDGVWHDIYELAI